MTGTDKHLNADCSCWNIFAEIIKTSCAQLQAPSKSHVNVENVTHQDESMYRNEPNHLSFLNFYLFFEENGACLLFVSVRPSLIAFWAHTHCIIALESLCLEWYNQRFAMILQIEISIYFEVARLEAKHCAHMRIWFVSHLTRQYGYLFHAEIDQNIKLMSQ